MAREPYRDPGFEAKPRVETPGRRHGPAEFHPMLHSRIDRWDDSCTIPGGGMETPSFPEKGGSSKTRERRLPMHGNPEPAVHRGRTRADGKQFNATCSMRTSKTPTPALARVLAVTVNYRTAELAIRCLASLEQEKRNLKELRAVVVDNASGDGSGERLRAALTERNWGDWVRLVENPTNSGFGAGNNLVLREALARPDPPDCFLLVNPDAFV